MSTYSKDDVNCKLSGTNHCEGHPEKGRLCFAVTAMRLCGENPGSYRDRIHGCREECEFFSEVMDNNGKR